MKKEALFQQLYDIIPTVTSIRPRLNNPNRMRALTIPERNVCKNNFATFVHEPTWWD